MGLPLYDEFRNLTDFVITDFLDRPTPTQIFKKLLHNHFLKCAFFVFF